MIKKIKKVISPSRPSHKLAIGKKSVKKKNAKRVIKPAVKKKSRKQASSGSLNQAALKNNLQTALKPQSNPQNDKVDFDLDSLLIEEQINYSVGLESNAMPEVISALDQLIEGEKLDGVFKELLPQSEVKIRLKNKGQGFLQIKSYQAANSAHLLDLKIRAQQSSFDRPRQSALKKFFSEATLSQPKPALNIKKIEEAVPAVLPPSLLVRTKFIDRLDELGDKFHQYLFKVKKPKSVRQPVPRVAAQKSHKTSWLINFKFALNFALIALLLIAPIRGLFFYKHLIKTKGQVLGVSEVALEELKLGAEAAGRLDWQSAGYSFNSASNYLGEARNYLEQYNQSLLQLIRVIPSAGKKLASAENLLLAGESLSAAAQAISRLFAEAQSPKDLNLTLTDGLIDIQQGLTGILADLEQAGFYLKQVDASVVPPDYREFFVQIQSNLPEFENNLQKFRNLFGFSLMMLGHEQPMRYLLMFQNPYELRPSGGFFGSYAILDVKKGEIVNLEVPAGGTYDTKGYMTGRVIAPAPLHLVGSAWSFWDSNWFVDFKTSAVKAQWFLEQSGGPTVDGVIALNATLIPELLKIVGNIDLPEYDKILTPADVVLALQHATLFEYDKSKNQPKEIISDLAPVLIQKLLSLTQTQTLPFILTLNKAFKEKEIQLYFADDDWQSVAAAFGWTGAVDDTPGNYLMVVDSNIAGGKTNAYMESEIKHYAYLQTDGSIVNTVSITRRHKGDVISPDDANYVFARANNVSYLKVYVPLGAELIEVTGQMPPDKTLFKQVYDNYHHDPFLKNIEGKVITEPLTGTDIYVDEFNKTAFGNWLQTEPGQESTLTISYRLAAQAQAGHQSKFLQLLAGLSQQKSANYSLLVQKQSGARNVSVRSFLFLPDNWQVDWLSDSTEAELKQTARGVEFFTDLTSDQYFAVVASVQ